MNNIQEIEKFFQQINCYYVRDKNLSECCSWRIGGKCKFLVEPDSTKQIVQVVEYCNGNNVKYIAIGAGSNILFSDNGFDGVVIRLGKRIGRIIITGRKVFAEAGAFVPWLSLRVAKKNLSGLEHTIGIPGSIGGLVTMNGGSNRHSISEYVNYVEVVEKKTSRIIRFCKDECGFDYRKSIFQQGEYIIGSVELELKKEIPYKKNRKDLLNIMRTRRAKFPLKYPSCGSVFKSTPELYSQYGPPGKIIEDLGIKGKRVGNVMVSEKHANFIINLGNGKAKDVLDLVDCIQISGREKGIELYPEFKFIGDE